MEDKRTLLAFLFIGLILLLMPYYFEWVGVAPELPPQEAPPPSPDTPTPPAIQDASKPGSVDESPIGEDLPTPPPSTGEFTARDLVVETPLQRLVLSTRGGVVTSVRLLSYNQKDHKVELVPSGKTGLVLSLKEGGQFRDYSKVEFVADREKLHLRQGEQASVRLRAELGEGRFIEKVFGIYADRYALDLELRYGGFGEDTEAFLKWESGIALVEGRAALDLAEIRGMAYMNEELAEFKLKDEEEPWTDKGTLKWVGARNKYFLTALIPQGKGPFRAALGGRMVGAVPEYSYELGAHIGSAGSWKNLVYLGPLAYEELTRYHSHLERAMNLGWPIVREISKFLLVIFVASHQYIPNYGWIIILFALAVKLLLYPLTHKTYDSAAKMQALQPKMTALREKYKNDNQRLSRETMKLYREEGVNPLGGCLPMLPQMPIFFALYRVFRNTIQLRQAPFALWIGDLSLPDELTIAGFGVHVLPLLMAISMFAQQKMTMKDPKQAALVYIMPAFMVFMFWNMSSGLVLYWTVFNILTIGQQWLINHLKKKDGKTLSPLSVATRK